MSSAECDWREPCTHLAHNYGWRMIQSQAEIADTLRHSDAGQLTLAMQQDKSTELLRLVLGTLADFLGTLADWWEESRKDADALPLPRPSRADPQLLLDEASRLLDMVQVATNYGLPQREQWMLDYHSWADELRQHNERLGWTAERGFDAIRGVARDA